MEIRTQMMMIVMIFETEIHHVIGVIPVPCFYFQQQTA